VRGIIVAEKEKEEEQLVVLEEITERKRAEEMLRRFSEELELKVEERTKELRAKEMELIHAGRLSSLGEMATGIAHELNQPLSVISMVNILTNARQVLDERGEEAVDKGEAFEKRLVCRISRSVEGDSVVFEFGDNAYGVPEELKTRVFEPFFTTKEPGEGTGLGLSIAYSIVTQSLDGKIWVEDNEAGGASFKVAMPLGEKTERRE